MSDLVIGLVVATIAFMGVFVYVIEDDVIMNMSFINVCGEDIRIFSF